MFLFFDRLLLYYTVLYRTLLICIDIKRFNSILILFDLPEVSVVDCNNFAVQMILFFELNRIA